MGCRGKGGGFRIFDVGRLRGGSIPEETPHMGWAYIVKGEGKWGLYAVPLGKCYHQAGSFTQISRPLNINIIHETDMATHSLGSG